MKLPSPAACPHPHRMGSSTRSSPNPCIKCGISISYFHLNTCGSETQMSSFYARRNSCRGRKQQQRPQMLKKTDEKIHSRYFLILFFFFLLMDKEVREKSGREENSPTARTPNPSFRSNSFFQRQKAYIAFTRPKSNSRQKDQ